ncbi:MAG: hypothetical protein ACRD88_16375 [Terriglobia bacterium]
MRSLRKILLGLAACFALGPVGASIAAAQGVVFLVSRSSRSLRPEGITETVGSVILAAQSSGVIVTDTILSFDYQAPIEPTSGTVLNGCGSGSLTKAVTGSVVTFRVTAPVNCGPGQSITVTGVRVNANFLGPGDVNAAVSALVPAQFAATNPITILQLAGSTVGRVEARTAAVAFTGRLVLLAAPTLAAVSADTARFTVKEAFNQAFLGKQDEQGLNNNGAVTDFKIRFAFRDVPIGLRIELANATGSDATLATLTASGAPFTSRAGSQDANVEITIDDDDSGTNTTGSLETLAVEFLFWVPSVPAFVPTFPGGSVRVELAGADSAPGVPRFGSDPLFSFPDPSREFPFREPVNALPHELNVTDAASPASFTAGIVAPGMLASANGGFGANLLTGLSQNFFAESLPLPKTLGGVTIRVGGGLVFDPPVWTYLPVGSIEAPLIFAGPGRVLFQIPPGISLGDAVPVELRRPDGSRLLSTVRIVAAVPRIFTVSMTGRGQAAVLNQDNSRNGVPESIPGARPARRATVIRIFATGAGDTDPSLLPGEAAPASGDPLVLTRVQPTVRIGGIAASVLHSIMAPGFPGTWQIDAEVPPTVSPGPAVPLTVSAGGFESNSVTIAVE